MRDCVFTFWMLALPVLSNESRATVAPFCSSVAEVKALTPAQAAEERPVRMEAVVTVSLGGRNGFFVQDETGGVFVGLKKGAPAFARAGDWVEFLGSTAAGQYAPIVICHELKYLGRKPIPASVPVSLADFSFGRHDAEWVETHGVIRTYKHDSGVRRELHIASGRERLRVDICDLRGIPPQNLVGSKVRLFGAAGGYFNQDRQLLMPVLFVPDWSHVHLTHPASSDPFSTALRSTTSLFRYAPDERSDQMCKLRGAVTHYLAGKALFLRDDDGPIYIETNQSAPLKLGDLVEVAGFPALGTGAAYLQDAMYRVVGTAAPPLAVFTDASTIAQGKVRPNELVSIDGRLIGLTRLRDRWTLSLKSGEHTFDVHVQKPVDGKTTTLPEPGSRLRATGVVWMEGIDPKGRRILPSSFRILARSPADIAVLRHASWWTRGRLAQSAVALLGVVTAAFGWIWMLRRRVTAQTSTIAEKVAREAVAEERARTACEIHDTVAQGFMALGFQLEALSGELRDPPPGVRQHLERTMKMLRHSHEEVRHSLKQMRGEAMESEGLSAALRATVERGFPAFTPERFRYAEHGPSFSLPAIVEHNILRIGQEAATNAAKHAGARHLEVDLFYGADELRLRIADDGRGFTPAPRERSFSGEHFGLQIMHERARRIGGNLQIHSTPGVGTEIILIVPRARNRESKSVEAVATFKA